MNGLPAAWAHLAPYLFVAAAATASATNALHGRRSRVAARQPAPAGVGEEAARLWTVAAPWEPAWGAGARASRQMSRASLAGAVAGLAAFGLAIGRQPLVVFLGLFMVPTVVLAGGTFRRRGLAAFVAFAASDLCLVLGFLERHAATGAWTTPAAGHAGAGALLVALAAGLRLVAPAGGPDPEPGPALVPTGWFQGLFLAWWLGPPAGAALALVAVALWVAGAALAREGRASALLFAGGLGALLAGLGAGAAAVTAVGLAGIAFTMGERAVSLGTLALAPLSAPAASGVLPRPHASLPLSPWLPAALGCFVVAVALHLLHLLLPPGPPGPRRSPARARWVPALAAAALTAVVLAGRGGQGVVWVVYGLGVAGIPAAVAIRPAGMHYRGELPADDRRTTGHPEEGREEDAGRHPGIGSTREAALAGLGGALLIVALLIVGELTVTGLRTNFL